MKSIVSSLLMMLVVVNVHAQDGKPNMAQTIDYIQSSYPATIFYVAANKGPDYRMSARGQITDLKINIVGTQVQAIYRDKSTKSFFSGPIASIDQPDKDDVWLITFDIKEIESIEVGWSWMVGDVMYDDANETRNFPMFLAFNAAGKKPLLSLTRNGTKESVAQVMIPFTSARDRDAAIGEIMGSQLYKAFEHLRRLSGAPDPIRF